MAQWQPLSAETPGVHRSISIRTQVRKNRMQLIVQHHRAGNAHGHSESDHHPGFSFLSDFGYSIAQKNGFVILPLV